MKMSYQRAWLLVDEIRRICGHAVVKTEEGGGGATLTPFGVTLVARYERSNARWRVLSART